GIDRKKVKVLTSPKEIREDDIVILYNLFPNTFRGMDKARGKKIVSFLHFNGNNSDSDRINSISPVALFNEVDLSQSCELYKRYYHIEAPWTVIPYIPAERFRRIKPFKERKNKAFSVGTITYKTHKEFLEVYGDPCDQPIRKAVKDNPEFFKDTADSYSSDYLEDDKVLQVKENDNSLFKFIKKAKNRFTIGKQKQYFSFDMVEKFNEYKMHIVGEEILGIPGIGFVEGMACGSAYIGMDLPAYRDWGMIPGKHFITYDGTIEGLRDTIKFWQQPENQEKLETIANNGYEFVKSNFNSEKLSRKLLQGFYAI
ncbi:MAG: glycosyltransferase, partial [Muribaculaceae bacterium]|nr:glycosyltransferase [Muribaculaceae bacterium]